MILVTPSSSHVGYILFVGQYKNTFLDFYQHYSTTDLKKRFCAIVIFEVVVISTLTYAAVRFFLLLMELAW